MANRNFMNGGKVFKMRPSVVSIDMNFEVLSSAGEGIANSNAPLVKSIQMFSSAPASDNIPPIAGLILIRLQDVYNQLLDMNWSVLQEPLSGTSVKIDNSVLVPGENYTITVLGNSTAAAWHSAGIPADITPAVGVSFIAKNAGGSANTSTSRVQTSADPVIERMDIVSITNPDSGSQSGAQIILACRDHSGGLVAPADTTQLSINFLMSNSSVTQGQ